MAVLELNSSTYDVSDLSHEINRTSTLRFSSSAKLGDDPLLSTRTEVRFTYNGVVWFAGRVLPASRRIAAGSDAIDFVAADYFEFMGNNPCAEVNEWYNRSVQNSEDGAYPWPTGKGIDDIVTTEFASIVGVGKPILALDFSDLATDVRDIEIPDFQTKGKTWLGILAAITAAVPNVGYWLDPTTINPASTSNVGYTLRFYDLATVPATPKVVTLGKKNTAGTASANVEEVRIEEDVSQSYDKLTLNGWGNLRERKEFATKGWSITKHGKFTDVLDPAIVQQQLDGSWRYYRPDIGAWAAVNESSTSNLMPWTPNGAAADRQYAFRRYKVTKEIADVKLVKDTTITPPKIIAAYPTMRSEMIQYIWDTGPLNVTDEDGVYHVGQFLINSSTKVGVFTDGFVQDFGEVKVDPNLYPSFPSGFLKLVGGPAVRSYEKNYFVLSAALVFPTNYIFAEDVSVPPNTGLWSGIIGEQITCFWPTESTSGGECYVALSYTGKDPLSVTVSDLALGYDKHLVLYDQRFLKYTDLTGNVLRDDTATMTKYANAWFAMVKRKRVYGTITINLDPATVMSDFPMGCAIRLSNFASVGGTYDLPARLQSIRLGKAASEFSVSIGFDAEIRFRPVEQLKFFKSFFESNEIRGSSFTGSGGRNGGGIDGGPDGGFGGGNGGWGPGGGSGGCCNNSPPNGSA